MLDPLEPFDVYIWDGDPSNGGIGVFSGTFSGVTAESLTKTASCGMRKMLQ